MYLYLLYIMIFSWTHCSSLCGSLWMASNPLGMLTTPHIFVSSENSLRVHLILLLMSLMKILNCTGPISDPWGTPVVVDLCPSHYGWTWWSQKSSPTWILQFYDWFFIFLNVHHCKTGLCTMHILYSSIIINNIFVFCLQVMLEHFPKYKIHIAN